MFNSKWKNPNKQRLNFFNKTRQGRYERAIEDDAFAVKLFDKSVNERLQLRRDRLGISPSSD